MTSNRVPINYQVPPFPSLYDIFPTDQGKAQYLYYIQDIWRFTLFWTLIFYTVTHLAVAVWAVFMQCRNWKTCWVVPVIYAVIGSLEALITGSIIGLLLGAIYDAGNFKMSTWLPMVWAGVSVMILIMSSFPTQGGL